MFVPSCKHPFILVLQASRSCFFFPYTVLSLLNQTQKFGKLSWILFYCTQDMSPLRCNRFYLMF